MATKALLLSSTNKIKQSILASKDPALIKDYISWIDQRKTRAAVCVFKGRSEESADRSEGTRTGSERTGTFTLAALGETSEKAIRTEKKSFKQVAALLADGEAVVEMIRVQTYDKRLHSRFQICSVDSEESVFTT